MRYLYGDSTPFPLKENFLETLVELTETCVALLRVDHSVRQARLRLQRASGEAERDQRWLANVGQAASGVIKEFDRTGVSTLAIRQAEALRESIGRLLDEGKRLVAAERDATLSQLEATIVTQRSTVERILEGFLLTHTLPQTTWGLSWNVEDEQQVTAEALAMSGCGLEASFVLDIPDGHPWASAIRVGDLLPEACVHMPRHNGRQWRSGTKRMRLARYYITAVKLTPTRQTIVLQRRLRQNGGGYEFSWEGDELSACPLGDLDADEQRLQIADSGEMRQLLNQVHRGLQPLLVHRHHLVEAALQDIHVQALDAPAHLAQVLIDAAAPYARELVRRSASPQELSLKRDIENGRREELFVPAAAITDKIKTLPPEQQACFDAFGLSEGLTSQVTRPQEAATNPAVPVALRLIS